MRRRGRASTTLIRSLPRGYDTRIGRLFGEHDLSGGQWQSLAVARAFARDAALLILDEPTANLDARAESDLFRRFHDSGAGPHDDHRVAPVLDRPRGGPHPGHGEGPHRQSRARTTS